MDQEATELEKRHVHSVYENTAPYFNEVQSKAWPKVRQFLLEQKPGSFIVDIGCGTGKYLSVNSEIYNLGCDYCEPLVEIARNNKLEVMVCDNLNLPFREKCFDAVISIGVIHHFSTKQRRIRAIKEMARILLPGGQIMLYVWAMEQKSRRFEKQDVFVPWNKALLSRQPSETNQSEGKMNITSNSKLQEVASEQTKESETISINKYGQTLDFEQSHTTNNGMPAETCCLRFHTEDNRLYSAIGRSLRSWFFSRSLDESTLRRHIDKMRSLSPSRGWANNTILVQPSRHCSLDLGHQRLFLKERSMDDDDVFIENNSHRKAQWLIDLNSMQQKNGRLCGLLKNNGEQTSYPTHAECSTCTCTNEKNKHMQSNVLKRTSTTESNDSILDETVSVGDQETNIMDSKAYMRYYHVFREGELCHLIEMDVPELRVISSCFDHGNWCIIAEKK
ncbi:probable tRNA methyltransferase 9B [Spea bombifrons]|uniref:probable tRNA methyltransferase 9B n=1 Tax=Spea bombifrons TaxID=233779 RepID=UPI0023496A80|nr:probable tRNA methyltransferase 9B [Spea bombifrons]